MDRGRAVEPGGGASVAEVDSKTSSILELTREFVRHPSPAGSKGSSGVIEIARTWLRDHRLEARVLEHRGRPIALVGSSGRPRPGPTLCLNACADTAPVENAKAWSTSPFGAEIVDGWMYGRGAADSKVGVAIFCHVLRDWARAAEGDGNLVVLFDADEHTGHFRGAQRFIAEGTSIDAAMIGYPGLDAIRDGARGFWRMTITVFGAEEHSGGSGRPQGNAVVRAAELVQRLSEAKLAGRDDMLGLPPRLTVTGIEGGRGFSVVPDRCRIRVDVRLTPDWKVDDARGVVSDAVEWLDRAFPCSQRSEIHSWNDWPAYRLGEDDPVLVALRRGAARALGHEVPSRPAGPSNIGNYLATLGVPATCGFGVRYRRVHGVDECFETATVSAVSRAYELAVRGFLGRHDP